jgi:hypothetical protein
MVGCAKIAMIMVLLGAGHWAGIFFPTNV